MSEHQSMNTRVGTEVVHEDTVGENILIVLKALPVASLLIWKTECRVTKWYGGEDSDI